MAEIQQIVGPIVLIGIISFMVLGIISTSRSEKHAEEVRKQRIAERELQEEQDRATDLTVVDNAESLLPDFRSSLDKLRDRFSWNVITETIGIGLSEVRLLSILCESNNTTVTLPNLQASTSSDEERDFVRSVVAQNRRRPDFREDVRAFGLEALTDLPTSQSLRVLRDSGFVLVENPNFQRDREFRVTLTEAGRNLALLNQEFSHRRMSDFQRVFDSSRKEVTKRIASCLHTIIFRCGDLQHLGDSDN